MTRMETEWVETVSEGWNVLVGTDTQKILEALESVKPGSSRRTQYGDELVSRRIVESLSIIDDDRGDQDGG